jgi:hypothetical protein
MPEPEPDETPEFRSRTIGVIPADEDTDIVVQHVYHPDGSFCCEDCGSTHDPGLAGLIVTAGGEPVVSLLLTAEEAAALANRLDRVVNLIYESREAVPDIEREAARFAPAAPGTGE